MSRNHLIAALVPLIAITAILTGETMPRTADGLFHVHRIFAVATLDDFYPRWIPWFHVGYGYPVLNFYPPLATWLAGMSGLSAPVAFQAVTALFWMMGAVGMYGLSRKMLPVYPALLAVTLWAYAPVRFHEYWIQGSISHIAATALAPWLFLAVIDAATQPGRRSVARLGAAFGLMLLSHQPTSLLMALYVGPLVLITSPPDPLSKLERGRHAHHVNRIAVEGLLSTLAGFLLGAGIAAMFLLPMLLEIDQIVVNDQPTGNIPAQLDASFLQLDDLFRHPPIPDRTDMSATIPHTYGLLAGVLALAGTVTLLLQRRYRLALLLVAAIAMSVFLTLAVSRPLWLSVPLMDQLRFPWRVLRIGIVPLSLLGGASALWPPSPLVRSALLIALTIALSLPLMDPTGQRVDFAGLTAADMIRYEQATGAYGGTSYNEFKPDYGQRTPTTPPLPIESYHDSPEQVALTGDAAITRLDDRRFRVETATTTDLIAHQFYYPGWRMTLDGEALDIAVEPEYGLIQVTVPPGDHVLALDYAGTPVQRIAPWITLVAVVVVIFLGIPRRMDAGRAADGKNAVPTGMWLAISLILGALILRPVVVASPPDDPAAMEIRLDAHFGDAYALLGYTLHSQTIRDTLDITLFWRAHADTHLDYRPVVEVVNLRQTEVWGADRPLFIGPNPVTHTPDHFVSHRHRLDVEAPPYAAQVRVTLFDGDTPVGDPVLLPERIPIVAATPDADDPDYVFENAIGANVSCTDDEIEIVWQVLEPLAIPGVTVLVHGLDAAGEIVNQADGPPLDGDYPLDLWRRGQTLADHFSLPGAQRVAVGLYTADRRLTVTEGGQALTDHVIVVMCEG